MLTMGLEFIAHYGAAGMSRSFASGCTLLLLALASGCGGSDGDDATAVVRSPLLRTSNYAEQAPDAYRVALETSAGNVVIQVHRAWAPIGADRFYNLANGGFYDDTRIYRVLENFMAQWGLNGDPYVNQAWKNEYLVDDPARESNTRGRVTFAKGGLHTRTSEVFINYKANTQLDGEDFGRRRRVLRSIRRWASAWRRPVPGDGGCPGQSVFRRRVPRFDPDYQRYSDPRELTLA
jgi:cyclophilin family peptidyl-prolyl cis-trans isomerase